MTPVIESDDYREEVETLAKDPIIIGMAQEILDLPQEVDAQDYDFMRSAHEEYSVRGGTNARSIGGPARAIRRLMNQSDDERYKGKYDSD